MTPRQFLEVDDLNATELADVLERSTDPAPPPVLDGRGVALLFEKPSARTRNSSEMAVVQLGGHPLTIRGDEVGFDVRETVEDITRTLACYHAAIGARVFDHSVLQRMAAVSPVPVINLLSDVAHPCQALADLLTLKQEFGTLSGRRLAWVGDANNVCRSLLAGAALCGMEMAVAAPDGYGLPDDVVAGAAARGVAISSTSKPEEAVDGADAVVTDVWISMGQEAEARQRRDDFAAFTVDAALLDRAAPHAVFLHCLPAHRGQEVTGGVIDGPQSRVWPEAANRMHAMRGLLWWLCA
jgi:ornithine carbamoyltransferase